MTTRYYIDDPLQAAMAARDFGFKFVDKEGLGHKTLQMVKRYAHLSEAHTAKVVERMNKEIFG
jgi:hypothetical protein